MESDGTTQSPPSRLHWGRGRQEPPSFRLREEGGRGMESDATPHRAGWSG